MIRIQSVRDTITDEIKAKPLDLQTWRHFSPQVYQWLSEINPRIIVEVGSWKGYSTYQFAQRENVDQVFAIDTWLGALEFYTEPGPDRDLQLVAGYPSVYYQFAANMHHLGVAHKVFPIPLPSSIGLKLFDFPPDLIYIDGSHEYGDVLDDLRHAELLKPRYILCDDYGTNWNGVKRAVDDFVDLSRRYKKEVDEYEYCLIDLQQNYV